MFQCLIKHTIFYFMHKINMSEAFSQEIDYVKDDLLKAKKDIKNTTDIDEWVIDAKERKWLKNDLKDLKSFFDQYENRNNTEDPLTKDYLKIVQDQKKNE